MAERKLEYRELAGKTRRRGRKKREWTSWQAWGKSSAGQERLHSHFVYPLMASRRRSFHDTRASRGRDSALRTIY